MTERMKREKLGVGSFMSEGQPLIVMVDRDSN